MATGQANLKVDKQTFENKIADIERKIAALDDVISRYRTAKTNLDQFVKPEDSSYEEWVKRIDENINACGKAKAALNESKATLQKTVDQMDNLNKEIQETVSSATEAAKSSIDAAIKIAPLL